MAMFDPSKFDLEFEKCYREEAIKLLEYLSMRYGEITSAGYTQGTKRYSAIKRLYDEVIDGLGLE